MLHFQNSFYMNGGRFKTSFSPGLRMKSACNGGYGYEIVGTMPALE